MLLRPFGPFTHVLRDGREAHKVLVADPIISGTRPKGPERAGWRGQQLLVELVSVVRADGWSEVVEGVEHANGVGGIHPFTDLGRGKPRDFASLVRTFG